MTICSIVRVTLLEVLYSICAGFFLMRYTFVRQDRPILARVMVTIALFFSYQENI